MSAELTGLLLAVEEEDVSAGPIGLVIILLLLIATFLLVRNMNGRLKRLPREFPPPAGGKDEEPPAAT